MLSSADRAPRSLLLTSSVPSEGKTSTALSIAATAAKSGQRTIIIDCDLRHPNLHINLNASNAKGLSEYLSGHLGLDDVIEIDPDSSVHYITAGARTSNPTDLLGSDAMRGLIRRLCNDYELVILDTPPLLAVSDALVLVREVDRTIFVIRWEKTRRETAMAGLKQALEAGARVAGTVLTRVDVRKHSQYDYADSGYYYYGSYRKYYTD
jgi:capsular exopolysaccharide synthesis family protein